MTNDVSDEGSRLGRAVDLVLSDVVAVLGSDAVAVAMLAEPDSRSFDEVAATNPEMLESLTRPRTGSSPEAWAYVLGESGAIGLDDTYDHHPFDDLVVQVAELLQELVMRSERFSGAAWPPCPEHPNTPLWAKVRDGEAVWACIDGGSTVVPIGSLRTGSSRKALGN